MCVCVFLAQLVRTLELTDQKAPSSFVNIMPSVHRVVRRDISLSSACPGTKSCDPEEERVVFLVPASFSAIGTHS